MTQEFLHISVITTISNFKVVSLYFVVLIVVLPKKLLLPYFALFSCVTCLLTELVVIVLIFLLSWGKKSPNNCITTVLVM